MANYTATRETRLHADNTVTFATWTIKYYNWAATGTIFPNIPYGVSPWAV